jgi:segregation and condensation protein B
MPNNVTISKVGAILFVATGPLTTHELASITGDAEAAIQSALTELKSQLPSLGMSITHLDGHYRLVSAPDVAPTVRSYMISEAGTDLTKAALETLAIIAYRGPLTRSAIEDIRGVASDAMIRNLLSRGLITESGRSSEPGQAIEYAISHGFLQHFGLSSPDQLPPVPEPAREN